MKQIAILIPTLPVRIPSYSNIIMELNRQIVKNGLEDKVQIVSLCDTKDYTVGRKRNLLLNMSLAKYICFLDDDDWISEDYVQSLYLGSLKNVDCVCFKGQYLSNESTKIFDMSLSYRNNYNTPQIFCRLPNHLSLIKRDIALNCLFPNKQYGEDEEYSVRLKKHLKTEYKIDKVLYFYRYNEEKSQTNPNSLASSYKEK